GILRAGLGGDSSMAQMAEAGTTAGENRTIALIGAGHFLSHFYALTLPPLFLFFREEFSVSYALLGALVTGYAMVGGVLQAPVGLAVDRWGAKPVLLAGLALNAAAIAAIGLVSSYWALALLAVAAGIGNSVFHPADYAVLAARIRERRLPRAYSLHTFLGFFGTAVAPLTMATLAALMGWRHAVMLAGAAGIATVLAMAVSGGAVGSPPRTGDAAADAAPARWLSLPILLFFGFFAAYGLASGGIMSFTVIGLGKLYGLDPASAGAVLTTALLALAFGILAGGELPDRERWQVYVTGAALVGGGALTALAGFADIGVVGLAALLGVAGFAMGVVLPARDLILRRITPPGSTGRVIGFVFVGLSVGGGLAPLLFGWTMDREWPALLFLGCGAFLVLAFLCSFGAVLAARRMPR
ncbi:MAG: MFS transporter, partial [Alphaproteobacteria bacterium]|nr:MFS transporter [Alphaproteobacteria bacterium]